MIKKYYNDATFEPILNISHNIPLELLHDIKHSYYSTGTTCSDDQAALQLIEAVLQSIQQELKQHFRVK